MQNIQTVISIYREKGVSRLPLERVYRQLYNREYYLHAYGKLYRNAGAMTPESTSETVDGMTLSKIDQIIETLRAGTFKWRPCKRVQIPKPKGGTRPLGLPAWSDKLVQEVLRLILESYYEPQFSDNSHGFRPNRSCHSALEQVRGRKRLKKQGIRREAEFQRHTGSISQSEIASIQRRSEARKGRVARRSISRLSKEQVSRTISAIGKAAGVIVRLEDERTNKRRKYASAHDLRRGCAQRLINAGVSAETLKIVLRHKDFATTEKFYGAIRSAQSAAAEVQVKLATECKNPPLVGGLMGGTKEAPQLSAEELLKLKSLLNSL